MGRFGVPLLAIVALTLAGCAGTGASRIGDGAHGAGKVAVMLSPAPKADGAAAGKATFTLSEDGKLLRYELTVAAVDDATGAEVREAPPGGTPGEVVARLYPEEGEARKEGTFFGTLAKGGIDGSRLLGPMKGRPVPELFAMISKGRAGVAVRTKGNPDGVLWGIHTAPPRVDLLAPCKCAEQ